jgi:hypothetical protein
LLGNLASNVVSPLAQGASASPNTSNSVTTAQPNSLASLISNPIVLIGGAVLLILLLRK